MPGRHVDKSRFVSGRRIYVRSSRWSSSWIIDRYRMTRIGQIPGMRNKSNSLLMVTRDCWCLTAEPVDVVFRDWIHKMYPLCLLMNPVCAKHAYFVCSTTCILPNYRAVLLYPCANASDCVCSITRLPFTSQLPPVTSPS